RKQSVFLYVGIVAGFSYFMDYLTVFKYLVLLPVIWIAIKIYHYANRHCGGLAAGTIAGVCTMAMNFSGMMLSRENSSEILFGASEALLAMGTACVFHYLMEICRSLHLAVFEMNDMSAAVQPTDGRMDAFVSAVGGLAEAVMANSRKDISVDLDNPEDVDGNQEGTSGENPSGNGMLGAGGAYAASFYEQDSEMEYPGSAWRRRLQENRMAVVRQLSAMVDLLKDWNSKEQVLDDRLRLMMARILFETKEKGILVEDLHIAADDAGRRIVHARAASKWEGGIPSRNYARALSRAMHEPMRLAKDTRAVITKDWTDITAYEDTVYYTLPGIAMHKRDDSVVTGDNFTMFDLDSGIHYIGLSDGMGSGLEANQESELVVDLLERLIRAGFDEETTISLMNSAFVLQGDDRAYSTLDLAAVDLYSGDLRLLKVGAAASFLKSGDEVRQLSAASLPTGSRLDEQPGPIYEQIGNGDFLVMVTDGVLECFRTEDAGEHFAHMIAGVRTDNAGVLARTLLEKSLRVAGGRARDDMTVLVMGIWEKK
ncbi:MAG: SpoIIE family protein phosphatase, partial [Clostridiales bacterium]|nr:SpoIIE family protein phosphatase [Clostridiales bacterium]